LGIVVKQIPLITFSNNPLIPLPKNTPPIYFGGKIPASANVEAYVIPPISPKNRSIVMSAVNAAPGDSSAFVISGRIIMSTASPI
jgi:hypothetical protein